MSESDKTTKSSAAIIRGFYALITIGLSLMVAYFVYQNTVLPESKYPFKLGLDLAGGSHLIYEADVSSIAPNEVDGLMNVLRDVIERRINIFGVSEPIVQVQQSSFVSDAESNRLVVELPGVTDVAAAVAEIGSTPLLEFKLVDQEVLAAQEAIADINTGEGSSSAMVSNVSVNGESIDNKSPYIDTGLTGRYLESAQLQFSGQSNQSALSNEPIVGIKFNDEGGDLFEQITRDNVGGNLAIFLDGQMISAPRINEAISGGSAVISGGFTPDEARSLAENLNFGALPVPIKLISTQTIGSTLGDDVLQKGVMAGVFGIILVGVFMVLWYRLPGLVAIISLLSYVALMLALFQLIPVTLTAAGLAGFILSLGMAVDANVLVFERVKEEFRSGKSFQESARIGFARAWSAIRDGNLTSILSAIILFWFGTSLIKGFALVFGIGVIFSMFSALLITRTLLVALPDRSKEEGVWGVVYDSGVNK